MRRFCESKHFVSFLVASLTGLTAHFWMPFPESEALLQLIRVEKPYVFFGLKWTYFALCFTTPFFASSAGLSIIYIFLVRREERVVQGKLPRYTAPTERDRLFLIVGEIHHPKKPVSASRPRWLTIPRRGLFTGVAIFGATGSGKTSCCMYPFAEQILAYKHDDRKKRVSALILEVKGDFCHKVREILTRYGRHDDYIELSLESEYRYNPLYNDLEAYALAYGIASLLNNLFGKGKEPFWQQAYTNLVKFIILLHKVLYDYVTLFDVYECAINPELLEKRIEEGREMFRETTYLLIEPVDFLSHESLDRLPFELDSDANRMKAPMTQELIRHLKCKGVPYEVQTETGIAERPRLTSSSQKQEQFEAVERWFYHDWMRIEPKLRTSIVEGISVFLSLFDDNPAVKRTFCPPKECYDPENNKDGKCGRPLPSFAELIENGKVCALNFPVSTNPGLARAIGTFLKQDFQRAVLNRIPQMETAPDKYWREVLFLCDEYHSFATVGESDPTGDEKFFSLSRQARCIPIVATQSISSLRSTLPGESWRTLLQTFRTKIFLALSDDFSTRVASEQCGKEEQLRLHYNLSEHGQDARVSMLTGRTTSHKSSVSASKSYSVVREVIFEPKVFAELKNAQSIVLAYDGLNPHAPSYCYLKPYYLDPNTTYFEHISKGAI